MKNSIVMKTGLMIFCLALTLVVHFYGNNIPYVNVSQNVFEHFLLLLSTIVCGFIYKKSRRIVFVSSIIFAIFLYAENHTINFASLIVAALFIPQISKVLLINYLSNIISQLKKLYKNYYWQMLAITITILVFIFYAPAFHSYFEGDEWVFFRFFRDASLSPLWFIKGFLDTFNPQKDLLLHATPLTSMFFVIQYKIFALNFNAYFTQSLITHILVSLTFAWFIVELTQSKKYAFIASILFATAAAGSEAITWIAATYTQNSLLLSLMSSIFMLKFIKNHNQKYAFISSVLLGAALLSKEIALSFIIFNAAIYLILIPRKKWNFVRDFKYFAILLILFIGMQIVFRSESPLKSKVTAGEYISHYVMLSSKAVSQSLLPNPTILHLSESITDSQFPYFNQEKKVRGTNYLMFIQTAAIEFMSHIMTLILIIILYFLVRKKKDYKLFLIAIILFFSNTLPLSFIFFKFPFWKYQASIDSRHLYSVLPALIIFIVIAIENISEFTKKNLHLSENVVLSLITILILINQFSLLHSNLITRQEDISLPERKMIVSSMQKAINYPPKQMIIYTTSNKSFYGFAAFILPFQTAFSQVLPVIFDQNNHPHGQKYPSSFFQPNFIGDNGLVSEGYTQEGGYGLGYFLDLHKVIKLYESQNLSLNSFYAFSFNGDTGNLENITLKTRAEIKKQLNSRKIFSTWKRHGSEKDYFSFQTSPDWTVLKNKNEYTVLEKGGRIMSIQLLNLSLNQTFSDFVAKQRVNNKIINNAYTFKSVPLDLDLPRFVIYPINNENIYFTTAGNGLKVYRFDIYNKEKADQIIRTMEFIDQKGENISL